MRITGILTSPRQRNVTDFKSLENLFPNLRIHIFVSLFLEKKTTNRLASRIRFTRVSPDVRVVSRRRLGLPRVRRMRPINRINFKGIPRVARDSCRSSTVISEELAVVHLPPSTLIPRIHVTRASCVRVYAPCEAQLRVLVARVN